MTFPHLFSPYAIKDLEIRNRIVSTGHDTGLAHNGLPGDALVAYHRERAKGGAGLIVIQVVGVHASAFYTDHLLMGTSDDCIPAYAALIDAIHAEGAKVIVQLFHPGREVAGRPEGVRQPAFAPSASPAERFQTIPSPLSSGAIGEIVEGFGEAARRMVEAGADGVELIASHGYLLSQFISPHVNRRDDKYGGSFENRLRFPREVIGRCRKRMPPEKILGMRISLTEYDLGGMTEDDTTPVCRALAPDLDYLSVVAGSSETLSSAVHIVPPMTVGHGYLSSNARTVKQATGLPIMVTGRINQPQDAERIIAEGAADFCGMTRAMICDPDMPRKAATGDADGIRACIGCNQACIGHFHMGLPISCIQHPETGRELAYGVVSKADTPRSVMVVGGGVAGMKAAVSAAERGHNVTLHEENSQLGGQALLAQLLPGRSEFGGIVTNLERELGRSSVTVNRNRRITIEDIRAAKPDALILATGSAPVIPKLDLDGGPAIVHAAEVLAGVSTTGNRVVVYDWKTDWVGAGIAEHLAKDGAHVRLAVNGPCAGASLVGYMRDEAVARLYRLGVEVVPFMRLFGAEGFSAYFLHTSAQEPMIMDDVDTIVLVCPNRANDRLADAAREFVPIVHVIGDALNPRTAEEAVFEGLKAACAI